MTSTSPAPSIIALVADRRATLIASTASARHGTAQHGAAAQQSQTTPKPSRACFYCNKHVIVWQAHKEARAKPLLALRWSAGFQCSCLCHETRVFLTAPPPPGSMGLPSAYSVYPGTARCVRLNLQRMGRWHRYAQYAAAARIAPTNTSYRAQTQEQDLLGDRTHNCSSPDRLASHWVGHNWRCHVRCHKCVTLLPLHRET